MENKRRVKDFAFFCYSLVIKPTLINSFCPFFSIYYVCSSQSIVVLKIPLTPIPRTFFWKMCTFVCLQAPFIVWIQLHELQIPGLVFFRYAFIGWMFYPFTFGCMSIWINDTIWIQVNYYFESICFWFNMNEPMIGRVYECMHWALYT